MEGGGHGVLSRCCWGCVLESGRTTPCHSRTDCLYPTRPLRPLSPSLCPVPCAATTTTTRSLVRTSTTCQFPSFAQHTSTS